jgi:hypothetical protein
MPISELELGGERDRSLASELEEAGENVTPSETCFLGDVTT